MVKLFQYFFYFLFSAIIIRIENTYGNDTRNFRTHIAKLIKEYGPIPKLGTRRIESLRYAFDPSISELKQLVTILTSSSSR